MTTTPDIPSTADRFRVYRWPTVVLGLGLLAFLAYLLSLFLARRTYLETLDRAGQAGAATVQNALAVAEKFQSGKITQTFISALPQLVSSDGGRLEVATLEQVETLRAEDERSLFWDRLPLGKTISEVRVPVTYRYHLELKDPWKIEISGQTCIVLAPPIRPSLPPALHTDRLERRSEAGWGRFNAREQMEALEKNLTPTLSEFAADPRRMALAREASRRAVAEFVRNWLLKEDHWRADRFRTIRVLFADEASISLGPAPEPIQVPLQ